MDINGRYIGIWVQLDMAAVGATAYSLFPDLAKEKPHRLVRWDYIRAAELFDDKADLEHVVGFRRQAA